MRDHRLTVAVRLLWPGTGRMAVEEARRLPASLVVYRQSRQALHYALDGLDVHLLRTSNQRGALTPLFEKITLTYFSGRGSDATVDLDLIARASYRVRGPALFHDQFAGLTGYLRRIRTSEPYAIYIHETALGRPPGVRTVRSPLLNLALRTYDQTVLRGAKLVLTNSRLNQRILEDSGVRSSVVYPGCNPLVQLPDSREPIVLATSVWDCTRNMDFYVDLARRTRGRVVLAGAWGRPEELREFASRHRKELEITGPISESALDELSRKASAYVRFGFGERGPGQGGIQALAYGIPVITNRGLAMSELIDEGENGFVVESAAEAAETVNALIGDPVTHRRMSLCAWEKSKLLSWDAHAVLVREKTDQAFPR